MAFVDKLPMDMEESRNIHPGFLPQPYNDLGVIDVVNTSISVARVGVGAAGSAGLIAGAATLGVGLILTVVSLIYSWITSNQARVRAHRRARAAKWQAFYETGVVLIKEVYGSTQDFDIIGWSHAHNSHGVFGQYYELGKHFYFWRGGEYRDLSISQEGFRQLLLNIIKGYGLDPTRIMGYENVGLDEELNPKTEFVAFPEKILTAKEILIGSGYSTDEINRITFMDSLTLFYDAVMIDLPNLKTEDEAKSLLNEIDVYLSSMELDPSIFFKKATSALPSPQASQSTVAKQPVTILSSEVPKVEAPQVLQAGMPIWGWIVISGIALSAFLGEKHKGRE